MTREAGRSSFYTLHSTRTRRSREGGAPTDRDRVAGRGPPVCDAYW